MDKVIAKQKLSNLIDRYNASTRSQNHSNISEETIRTWLNEFLLIFGWDVQNVNQVLQEQVLTGVQRQRLNSINSRHRRPDYTLLNGPNIKTFLDAKSLNVNIFTDTSTAFQIRSYGWSAQAPCAFVSNFEQLVIYDTRFIPSPEQPVDAATKKYYIDDYLNKFDEIFDHFDRDLVCANRLNEVYPTTAVEGRNKVDGQFMQILSQFRIELAEDLFQMNPEIISTSEILNYYVQVILDRLVFIRVCESKGIEEQEKLKSFKNSPNGFWNEFKNSCYMEFYKHYDGAMFERDTRFQQLQLDNTCLEKFVDKLYYPYPYCFDVIPIKVIANIYEEFLGKQLVIVGNQIREITKDEYIRSNGVVITPEHIVDMVCKQALKIDTISNISKLLSTRILDPCCGSGIFIVSCYELLADKIEKLALTDPLASTDYQDLFYISSGKVELTVVGRRELITKCLYAIDCDEAAVEVTKMSLALKIVDGNGSMAWNEIGVYGNSILQEVANNIVLGNSLVPDNSIFTPAQIQSIKPLDIGLFFSDVFIEHGGFDYVVGNPPYVETKYYKAAQPEMHSYLSEQYRSFSGKADLAVLFIERGLQLLNSHGRLGFIIQRRWFRTEYGREIRTLINEGKYLEKLIDFKATDIFAGRIVYASIMILSKEEKKSLDYYFMPFDASTIKVEFENSDAAGNFNGCNYISIPAQQGNGAWSFDNYTITLLKNELTSSMGTLGNYPNLAIKDGIQALWKKIYHLKNVSFSNGIATGVNGFGETVTVEQDCLRGVIYNCEFYPFKDVQPDAYCIFPYHGASNDAYTYTELYQQRVLTYNYLAKNKTRIQDNVSCREGDMWHTFTREHNHNMYDVDKIIIPMTARDTIATFVSNRGLYMDNSNVWFISVDGANRSIMKAITSIINSTVFSVLGKSGANPQRGGYYKFNKQFLTPIPFPSGRITENASVVSDLNDLYDNIYDLQVRYIKSNNTGRAVLAQSLRTKWQELDDLCCQLYDLSTVDRQNVAASGRTISRIELLNGVG